MLVPNAMVLTGEVAAGDGAMDESGGLLDGQPEALAPDAAVVVGEIDEGGGAKVSASTSDGQEKGQLTLKHWLL